MIGLCASCLLCLVVGAVVDRGLFHAPGRGFIEQASRALALGLGTLGVLSLFMDGLGLGVSPVSVFSAAGLLTALLLWPALRVKRVAPRDDLPKVAGKTAAFCVAMLAVAALLLGFAAYTAWIRPTFQMDALVRWMFKAKALALDGTLLGPLSTNPAFHFTHQRYPPLVSHVANLPYLFSGVFNDRVASAIFPAYAVALVGVVFGALRRIAGPVQGCVGALWVASLPLIAFREGPPPLGVPPGSGAFSALADVPLALFACCAALAVFEGVERRRNRAFLEAGVMLAFAALTKNEGLVLVAGAAAGILLCARQKRFQSLAVVVALVLALYALLWGRIALQLPALDEHYPGRLSLEALTEGLHRIPDILAGMAGQILFLPAWNLVGPAVILLLLLSGRAAVDRGGTCLLLICLIQVAAYALAYTITAWTSPAALQSSPTGDPVPFLMDLTLGRLLLHIAPIALVAALRAAPLEKRRLSSSR